MTLGNDNGTDGQTDRRTDRMRRIMRPPPREEGRIKRPISEKAEVFLFWICARKTFYIIEDSLLITSAPIIGMNNWTNNAYWLLRLRLIEA